MLLAILTISLFSFNEPDNKVFTNTGIVWCDIDFSQARLIGAEVFTDPVDIKDRFFASWNELVLHENDKYDIQKFYLKKQQTNDLSIVSKRNEMPDVSDLVINEDYAFQEGQLAKIINTYEPEVANEGLGVVYVIESFDESSDQCGFLRYQQQAHIMD